MKVISEKPVRFINMELDMSQRERCELIQHANDNMLDDELEGLLVEWAFVDLIKRHLRNQRDLVKAERNMKKCLL